MQTRKCMFINELVAWFDITFICGTLFTIKWTKEQTIYLKINGSIIYK